MAIFKDFSSQDVRTERETLNQLVDIIENDISSSLTRKKYQIFVTGGVGPGVTSSLFQTVFDQDFTLQTANPVFDVTFGLSANSQIVMDMTSSVDATTGKYYFVSQSMMMREKMDIYNLFAKNLLGDASTEFTLVSGSTTSYIREPLFICFKRLFARDRVKRETFAIKMYNTASFLEGPPASASIYTDVGSSTNKEYAFGGQVSAIVDSSNTSYPVGQLYLDKGIAVLDTQRIFHSASDLTHVISGTINSMCSAGTQAFTGSMNQFFASGSMDNILDHICSVRFSGTNQTAIAFQNETFINSTIFFCKFEPKEYNYSSNPTYLDSDDRIVVITPGQEDVEKSFTFVTSIGLYDANDNLLAVAKTSRPILKNSARSFIVKTKLDF